MEAINKALNTSPDLTKQSIAFAQEVTRLAETYQLKKLQSLIQHYLAWLERS